MASKCQLEEEPVHLQSNGRGNQTLQGAYQEMSLTGGLKLRVTSGAPEEDEPRASPSRCRGRMCNSVPERPARKASSTY